MPLFLKSSKEDNALAFRQLEATIQKRRAFEKSMSQDPNSPYQLHPTTINYPDIHGSSLLHYAVALGDLEKVNDLVEQSADINLKNSSENLNVINIALAYNHCHIAQYLYEKGADFTEVKPSLCRDNDSRTWLKEKLLNVRHQLVLDFHSKKECIPHGVQTQFFKPKHVMFQIARRAVEMGDIEFIQALSEHDPELFHSLFAKEEKSEASESIFVKAAENGELGMLKFLFEKKQPMTSTEDYTTTPLMAAIQHHYQDVIDYLMTLNLDIHQQDNKKNTALFYAVITDNRKTTFQLLERGAKYNEVDCNGNTILHLAILFESQFLNDLLDLSEMKDLLDVKNIYGYTPVDYALRTQNKAIIEQVAPLADRATLKPAPISQNILLDKMHYYLLSQYRDTTVLPSGGHCNGFAFLKLFYTTRGMENYFFKTLELMANWEGNEIDLDVSFKNNEQMAYGYKNLRELFEQWINDVVWFQHDDILKKNYISRLAQNEHLAQYQFVGSPHQYSVERIHLDRNRLTINQLGERMRYWGRMPAKTQIMFSGGEHATSVFVDEKKGLHYYDPNFRYQSTVQTDPDVITQQIIDYKYIFLEKFAHKIEIETQLYYPTTLFEELNNAETLHDEERPKSKEEALLFQNNSANQWTPLHIAVVTHSLETFKKLIEENFCDINAKDAFQSTPLDLAVNNNFHEAIRFVLQTPGISLHTNLTSLIKSAYSLKYKETMDIMLGRPDLFDDVTQLLILGVCENDFDLVERLLTQHKNKIDVSMLNQPSYGDVSLSHAYQWKNARMIKCLLDNEASLFVAVANKTPLKEMMSQKFNFKKHYEIFDIILTEQNINQVDDLGCAAIHYAVQSSFFETVQEVIKRGGDIQQRTATGASVWDIFLNNLSQKGNSFFSNKDHQAQRRLICKLLVSIYKFNFSDPSDKRNFHALLISPVKNEEENALFQSLLEHCTSDFLNQNVTCASVPFLIYFMQNKQYNKIEPLLKKGVDVNCRDDNGNTFLMNLILADAQLIPEKYELIQLALAHNPDLETLKNNENETILESVRRSTDEKTLELFKDYLEPHPVMKLRNI